MTPFLPMMATEPPERKRRGRPPKGSGADTKTRLVDCARAGFGADGFDRTTVGGVSRRARIGASAFYHHFPDKESLYEAVFDATIVHLWDLLDESVREARSAHSALASLVDAADHAREALPHYPEFLTGLPYEAARHARFRVLLERRSAAQRRTFDRIVAVGRRTGEFPSGLSDDELAESLRFIVMGWLVERNLSGRAATFGPDGLLHLLGLRRVGSADNPTEGQSPPRTE